MYDLNFSLAMVPRTWGASEWDRSCSGLANHWYGQWSHPVNKCSAVSTFLPVELGLESRLGQAQATLFFPHANQLGMFSFIECNDVCSGWLCANIILLFLITKLKQQIALCYRAKLTHV